MMTVAWTHSVVVSESTVNSSERFYAEKRFVSNQSHVRVDIFTSRKSFTMLKVIHSGGHEHGGQPL